MLLRELQGVHRDSLQAEAEFDNKETVVCGGAVVWGAFLSQPLAIPASILLLLKWFGFPGATR